MSGSDSASNENNIAQKAARGIFWSFLAYGASKGVTFLSLIFLARLLRKDDFGMLAAALVIFNFLNIFKELGLGAALIQRRGNIEEACNTVFTLNLATGFLLSLLILPIAPFVAAYFGDPQLTSSLRWLGTSFLINAIGSVHTVLLKRELDFRRKFLPDMGSALSKGTISIIMALSGYGVWSLVIGQLVSAMVSVILLWSVLPWRPRLVIDRAQVGPLLKYGFSIMGMEALAAVEENLVPLVVGRFCGIAILGVYSLAYRLPEVMLIGNLLLLTNIFFPVFSIIQDRPEEIAKGFLFTVRLVSIIAVPLSLGLIIAADSIVRVSYGNQWVEVIPALRLLAIYAWVYSIGFHAGDIYKAVGRPGILFKLSLLFVAIELVALLIGARYGLQGIVTGLLCAMIFYSITNLVVVTRFVNVTLVDILAELKPSMKAGLALTFFALAAQHLTSDMEAIIQLACITSAGGTAYAVVLWPTEKRNLRRIFQTIRSPGQN